MKTFSHQRYGNDAHVDSNGESWGSGDSAPYDDDILTKWSLESADSLFEDDDILNKSSTENGSLRDYIDICLSSDVFRELCNPSSAAASLGDAETVDERRCQSLHPDTTTSSARDTTPIKRKCDHQLLQSNGHRVCALTSRTTNKTMKFSETSSPAVSEFDRVHRQQRNQPSVEDILSDTTQGHVLCATRDATVCVQQSWPNSLVIGNLFRSPLVSSSLRQPAVQLEELLPTANSNQVNRHDGDFDGQYSNCQGLGVDVDVLSSYSTPSFLSSSCDAYAASNNHGSSGSSRVEIFPPAESNPRLTGLPTPLNLVNFHPCDPRFCLSAKPSPQGTATFPQELPSNGSWRTLMNPKTSALPTYFDGIRRNERILPLNRLPPNYFDKQFPDKELLLFTDMEQYQHEVPDDVSRSNESLNTNELPSSPNGIQVQQQCIYITSSLQSSSSPPTILPMTSYSVTTTHAEDIVSSTSHRNGLSMSHRIQRPDRINLTADDVSESKKYKLKQRNASADDEPSLRTGLIGSSKKTIEALSVKIRRNLEQKSIIRTLTSSPSHSRNDQADSTVNSPSTSRSEVSFLAEVDDVDLEELQGQPYVNHLLCSSHSNSPITSSSAIQRFEHFEKKEAIQKKTFDGFRLSLDAPISRLHLTEDQRITYLNKGQYYRLSIELNDLHQETIHHSLTSPAKNVGLFKSVVMVQFRDPTAVGDEIEAWRLWHSRQPSYKQRILDIDYKNSSGVGPNSMQELAYNATSIVWNPANQPIKVSVAVNCLSTDFSTQKGVKGIPLNVQVDTYKCDNSNNNDVPIHRSVCRIKVFCEKGAERKIRDEERRKCVLATRNGVMSHKTDINGVGDARGRESNFCAVDVRCSRVPVLFIPSNTSPTTVTVRDVQKSPLIERKVSMAALPACRNQIVDTRSGDTLPNCSACNHGCSKIAKPALLLYVRMPRDHEFTPLHVDSPTVTSLISAIEELCGINAVWIRNVLRRSTKGITIKMDDKILQHYSNESAFVISVVPSSACLHHKLPGSVVQSHSCDVMYDVILTETDGNEPSHRTIN